MENALNATLHRFLVEKNLEKTAKAFLKETKVDLEAALTVSFDLEEAFKPLFEKEEKAKQEEEEAKKSEKKSKKKRSRSDSDVSEAPPKKRKKSEEKKEKKKDKKEKKDKKKEEEKKEEEKKEEEKEEVEDEEMEEKKKKKQITPFRRVKEEEIHIERAELRDNTYYAKFEKGGDSWGYKANKDLEKTRGKGFRHEKTKKKRGSYRGGTIDPNHVASVKFTYSDDEE